MTGRGISSCLTDAEIYNINQLLDSRNYDPITSSSFRLYKKLSIRGNTFSSKANIRVKRRNSYTIAFSVPSSSSFCYGLVEHFLSFVDQKLALVTELNIVCQGLQNDFTTTVTSRSRNYLFQDYLTYEEGEKKFIFADQIVHKCFNLTNNDWKVLSLAPNDIECE